MAASSGYTSLEAKIAALDQKVDLVVDSSKALVTSFGLLNASVIDHHAKDVLKCEQLSQLYEDIHGDGNGKKGLRREVDLIYNEIQKVKDFVDNSNRLKWLMIAAIIAAGADGIINLIRSIAQ